MQSNQPTDAQLNFRSINFGSYDVVIVIVFFFSIQQMILLQFVTYLFNQIINYYFWIIHMKAKPCETLIQT